MKKIGFALVALVATLASPAFAVAVYSTNFDAITAASGGTPQGDGSIYGVSSFSTGSPSAAWAATKRIKKEKEMLEKGED